MPNDKYITLLPEHLRTSDNIALLEKGFGKVSSQPTQDRMEKILNLFSQLPKELQTQENFNKVSPFIKDIYGGDTILSKLLLLKEDGSLTQTVFDWVFSLSHDIERAAHTIVHLCRVIEQLKPTPTRDQKKHLLQLLMQSSSQLLYVGLFKFENLKSPSLNNLSYLECLLKASQPEKFLEFILGLDGEYGKVEDNPSASKVLALLLSVFDLQDKDMPVELFERLKKESDPEQSIRKMLETATINPLDITGEFVTKHTQYPRRHDNSGKITEEYAAHVIARTMKLVHRRRSIHPQLSFFSWNHDTGDNKVWVPDIFKHLISQCNTVIFPKLSHSTSYLGKVLQSGVMLPSVAP